VDLDLGVDLTVIMIVISGRGAWGVGVDAQDDAPRLQITIMITSRFTSKFTSTISGQGLVPQGVWVQVPLPAPRYFTV